MHRLTVVAALLLVACRHQGLPGRYQQPDSMRAAVLHLVPIGSSVDTAQARLEREGFRCALTHGPFAEHPATDYLWCDATVGAGSPVTRRWQVAVFEDSGRVRDVAAKTGLIGP